MWEAWFKESGTFLFHKQHMQERAESEWKQREGRSADSPRPGEAVGCGDCHRPLAHVGCLLLLLLLSVLTAAA